jgi:hypothetical protein
MAAPKDKLLRFYRRRREAATDWLRRARGRATKKRVVRAHRREAQKWLRKIRHRRRVLAVRKRKGRTHGVAWYDGKQVAAWMVPYLDWARAHGWRGHLVSGWRDPVYSQRLCYAMCGRPSCPGRCAGLSSNHVGSVKPRGAVDVSDYGTFASLMRRCPYSPRIFNALGARDPVHFSASGR